MDTASVRDEYFHEPMNRRLWNESYYFDFTADAVRGFTRLGFQPFERRANVWFYLVHDGEIHWYRNERIPIEQVHGHYLRTEEFEQSYQIVVPHERWSLYTNGICNVSSSSWDVLTDEGQSVPVELDLSFTDPHHDPYSIDMLVETQDHYDQTGHYTGSVTLNGERIEVDGQGFRDHSWGWFRDWTPGKWGHYTGTLQFDSGDCVTLVAQIRPDGTVRDTYGYRASGEDVEPVVGAEVTCDDGLSREERGRAWAQGKHPETITYTIEFEDDREEIRCRPLHDIPIGYEDRNWALSDPDGPWLKGVLNRMPVDCVWNDREGSGWIEATHPFSDKK